jgi:hypothetical protein
MEVVKVHEPGTQWPHLAGGYQPGEQHHVMELILMSACHVMFFLEIEEVSREMQN